VPRIVDDPADNSPGCPEGAEVPGVCLDGGVEACLCVNSGCFTDPCIVPEPAPVEIRFDVTSVPVTLFSANVGSINQDHIVTTTQTPVTIYLEDAEESASGVVTKFDSNASLTVTLYVDGIARATDTSPPGNTEDAIVQYQFG
jgi:hypothetical protein